MKQKMTVSESLKWAEEELIRSCERPRYEAELLLAHHMRRERIHLLAHSDEAIENEDVFAKLIARRAANEPYEYIVGEASFYDLHLFVERGVLIPRPETELLIERASAVIEREGIKSLIEIGIGSGAISIVLARKFPHLEIIATDISQEALRVARRNIDRYGVQNRITMIKSNLMDRVESDVEMVISNPPYIADDFSLEKNVFDYEPHSALFGGKTGDELLRQIVLDTKSREIKWLACEMGYDQKESMQSLFNQIGVQYCEFYQDLAGHDRGFVVRFA